MDKWNKGQQMPSKLSGTSGGHVGMGQIDFNSDRKEGVTQPELHEDIDEEVEDEYSYFLETLRGELTFLG